MRLLSDLYSHRTCDLILDHCTDVVCLPVCMLYDNNDDDDGSDDDDGIDDRR